MRGKWIKKSNGQELYQIYFVAELFECITVLSLVLVAISLLHYSGPGAVCRINSGTL